MTDEPKWRVYEKVRAKYEGDYPGVSVVHDQKVKGVLSGELRQVDVWVVGIVGAHEIKIAIECKYREEAPVGVEEVEAFIGKLDDLGVSKGVLVTTNGFTRGAKSRAEKARALDLEVMPLEELDTFDWDSLMEPNDCKAGNCYGLIHWIDPSEDAQSPAFDAPNLGGDCTSCGTFNIRCGNCGYTTPALTDEVCCDGCGATWRVRRDDVDIATGFVLVRDPTDE